MLLKERVRYVIPFRIRKIKAMRFNSIPAVFLGVFFKNLRSTRLWQLKQNWKHSVHMPKAINISSLT